jgi:hypothetical protein
MDRIPPRLPLPSPSHFLRSIPCNPHKRRDCSLHWYMKHSNFCPYPCTQNGMYNISRRRSCMTEGSLFSSIILGLGRKPRWIGCPCTLTFGRYHPSLLSRSIWGFPPEFYDHSDASSRRLYTLGLDLLFVKTCPKKKRMGRFIIRIFFHCSVVRNCVDYRHVISLASRE